MSEDRLFLIDGHALCYRSFFAIKSLANSKGQATNAVYGFINTLRKILKEYKPQYVAVCFDSHQKTHRQEKFAEYKIQRPKMPDELISQIPLIKEVVKAYNIPVIELGGYEADDLIATIVEKSKGKGVDVVIVCDDKDMFQLASERVKFFSPRQDATMDYKQLKERLGFEPIHIVDFISLAGDASDNIPGVKGIGEVTAKKLIEEFGSLENIMKHLDAIGQEKVREKIQSSWDIALLSKELATLDYNAPFEFDLGKMKVREANTGRLFELFKDLEFKKFASEVSSEGEGSEKIDVHTLHSASEIEKMIKIIRKDGQFEFLIESNEGEGLITASKVAIIANKKNYELLLGDVQSLKEIFEDKGLTKITYDLKEALRLLDGHNIVIKGEAFDVKLAGYLLSPAQSSFELNDLAWNFLKKTIPSEGYLAHGVTITSELYHLMSQALQDKDLLKLFKEIEIPLSYVLFKMEKQGVKIDLKLLQELSQECDKKINTLTKELYKLAGQEFNINSPKQLSQVLFEKLKLPTLKKTKTGFSTDESVLNTLAQDHQFPSLILEYRMLSKLKSTYIDALPRLMDTKTNRIHAHFNQTGAETGRLSSNNPNLQNIPIRTELGREIRKAFIPSDKNSLIVAADYSQIELRILAHLSQDQNLIKAFKSDEDIHRYTASLIFEVKEDDVTAQMRDSAKRVNFGIIYGMSSFGLSKDLRIPVAEAQDFIDRYFLRYPGVKKFMDDTIVLCEKQGFVTTILNRRRYIPEIKSDNINIKQFAQRQAINTPVQGSAADLIKLAMINIQTEIEKNKLASKMIITVHDELVFDVPKGEQEITCRLVRQCMERTIALSLPIKVAVKIGCNWLETKEI